MNSQLEKFEYQSVVYVTLRILVRAGDGETATARKLRAKDNRSQQA